jgi:carbon-monoxide dehydrogenase medium subunit
MLKPFRLLRPGTIAEAGAELERHEDAAAVYAGGAELLLLMRQGLLQPEYLVDIKHIPELHGIRRENGGISIGAAVSHWDLERDGDIRERFPLLAEAESHVGNIRVRNQGTLGGNLCFADPHADPATPLLVLDAEVEVGSARGSRIMPLDDFLLGMYETALEPGELLTRIRVEPLPPGWGVAYQRIERFFRPTLNAAVAARGEGDVVADVRMAVGCVGPRAVRLPELESQIRGLPVEEAVDAIRGARGSLEEALMPVDDLLGSAAYKLDITTVALERALRTSMMGGMGD